MLEFQEKNNLLVIKFGFVQVYLFIMPFMWKYQHHYLLDSCKCMQLPWLFVAHRLFASLRIIQKGQVILLKIWPSLMLKMVNENNIKIVAQSEKKPRQHQLLNTRRIYSCPFNYTFLPSTGALGVTLQDVHPSDLKVLQSQNKISVILNIMNLGFFA